MYTDSIKTFHTYPSPLLDFLSFVYSAEKNVETKRILLLDFVSTSYVTHRTKPFANAQKGVHTNGQKIMSENNPSS